MARFIGFLIAILSRPHRGAPDRNALSRSSRSALLLTGSSRRAGLLAAEADSEGEGSAPPGLEDPSFEPGGEETALEGLPGDSEAEGSEGDGEEPPVEPEPIEQPEFTEPAPAPVATAELSPPAPAPEVPLPPPDESTPPPSYEPAQSAPSYEAAPQPPPEPMENDAIVAPPGAAEDPPSAPHPAAPQPPAASPEAVTEAPPPEASSQESEPLGARARCHASRHQLIQPRATRPWQVLLQRASRRLPLGDSRGSAPERRQQRGDRSRGRAALAPQRRSDRHRRPEPGPGRHRASSRLAAQRRTIRATGARSRSHMELAIPPLRGRDRFLPPFFDEWGEHFHRYSLC